MPPGAPLLLVLACVACGPRSEATPANVASSTSRAERAPHLGWIALANARDLEQDAPRYVLRDPHHPLVILGTPDGLPSDADAIDVDGTLARFRRGPVMKLPYGTDSHMLEVTSFDGPFLAPGAAWMLPPSRADDWSATVARVVPLDGSTVTSRAWRIGDELEITLQRTGTWRGTMTVSRSARRIGSEPFERVHMEGADKSPIDLRRLGPAIPEPVAAWRIADGTAYVVVTLTPGYEGYALQGYAVDHAALRRIDSMYAYIYSGAF